MPEIMVHAHVSEQHLREYQAEARRQGVPVERLVEQTVNCLLAELEGEEEEIRAGDVRQRTTPDCLEPEGRDAVARGADSSS